MLFLDIFRSITEKELDCVTSGGVALRARLRWREEVNLFINGTLGFERRSRFDERFRDVPPKHDAEMR